MSNQGINPKDAIGSTKLPVGLWPAAATLYGSLGLYEGKLKYGRANYRATNVQMMIYIEALLRHTLALVESIDTDPESGLHQLCHMLACCAILVDAKEQGSLVDDRPFYTLSADYASLVQRLTPHVGRLQQKYADKAPKHWTVADIKRQDTDGK
jgi:hypothetical protein